MRTMRNCEKHYCRQRYENPTEHACDMKTGQVFIAGGWQKPEGFCDSAWESVSPFVMTLAYGGENIYDGWMKKHKDGEEHEYPDFRHEKVL